MAHPIDCMCDECRAAYAALDPGKGRWVFVPDGHTVTIEPKRNRTDYHREYARKRRAKAKG